MASFNFYISRLRASEKNGLQIVCGEYLNNGEVKTGLIAHLKHGFMKGSWLYGYFKRNDKITSSLTTDKGEGFWNLQFNFSEAHVAALLGDLNQLVEEYRTTLPEGETYPDFAANTAKFPKVGKGVSKFNLAHPPLSEKREGCSDLKGYQLYIEVPDENITPVEVEESAYAKQGKLQTAVNRTLKTPASQVLSVAIVRWGDPRWVSTETLVDCGNTLEALGQASEETVDLTNLQGQALLEAIYGISAKKKEQYSATIAKKHQQSWEAGQKAEVQEM
jgi:hypothetical protein